MVGVQVCTTLSSGSIGDKDVSWQCTKTLQLGHMYEVMLLHLHNLLAVP